MELKLKGKDKNQKRCRGKMGRLVRTRFGNLPNSTEAHLTNSSGWTKTLFCRTGQLLCGHWLILNTTKSIEDVRQINTCFIIIVTTLQACKLSKKAFNIQTKTSKVA